MLYDNNSHTGNIEDDGAMACEPLGTYGAVKREAYAMPHETAEDVEELPSDILQMALECASDDIKNGRVYTTAEVRNLIAKDLGWK